MSTFQELPLSPSILRAIADLGFTNPSPIQAEALPILLGEATDFIGMAATGTGKTAAFAIPMIEKIDPAAKSVQSLVLCPTRELALQVTEQINLLGKYNHVRATAVYGGAGYAEQIQGFRNGSTVVVGTPGRIIDHIEHGTLKLANLSLLVLDEADEMISMGFQEDLEKILAAVPREKSQTWLFSATMDREVRRVADTYLREPKLVQMNRQEVLPSTVEQFFYPTHEYEKPQIICQLIDGSEDFYGLIFCQTKQLVSDLTQHMTERGYKVDSLHGDKDQPARERTMKAFRERKVNILICTDVAARGLDVKDITHVINYSLPREMESYIHRIGRTARSGKKGVAMNLVTSSHRHLIYQIERATKTTMLEGQLPGRRDIAARKIAALEPSFANQPFHSRALEVLSDSWKEQINSMPPLEVAARFLTMMMPDVFADRPAPPPRAHSRPNTRPNSRPARGSQQLPLRPRSSGVSRISSRTPLQPKASRSTQPSTKGAMNRPNRYQESSPLPEPMPVAHSRVPAFDENGNPLNRKARRALKFGTGLN